MRRGRRERLRRRGGNGAWPGAWSEERQPRGIPAWATSEAKKWPWRPAEVVAALCKVRNQFVGDVDFDGRLLGTGPELLHGLPGLIAQLAVDAALKALEPPELDLRLPDLLGRIGRQCRRRVGHGRPTRLGRPSTRVRSILRELDHAARSNR